MSELEVLEKKNEALCDEIICLKKELEKLRRVNELLEDDAERYRLQTRRQKIKMAYQSGQIVVYKQFAERGKNEYKMRIIP